MYFIIYSCNDTFATNFAAMQTTMTITAPARTTMLAAPTTALVAPTKTTMQGAPTAAPAAPTMMTFAEKMTGSVKTTKATAVPKIILLQCQNNSTAVQKQQRLQ